MTALAGWPRRWIVWWTGLWSRTEHPRSLALVRVGVGLVVLVDLLLAWHLELVVPLFGPMEAGGIGNPVGAKSPAELYQWFPATAETTEAAFWVAVLAAAGLLFGVFPRLAAVVLVMIWAQFARVLPPSDRGIDMLLRNVSVILAFSGAGETYSLGSLWRHRRLSAPDTVRVASWPRYLLIVQLVFVYGAAGVSKIASSWTPFGGMSALYIAMNDPAFQVVPSSWVAAAFGLTQVGTTVTWVWEWCGPLLLLAYFYRDTRERGGWLRSTFNRVHFVGLYFALGVIFHLATHLTLRLGIFPFAMMSLYPAAFHPEEWAAWGRRSLGMIGRRAVVA